MTNEAITQSSTGLPRLLKDSEAAALYGMGVRTFHELQHEHWMPKPVQLGARFVRWDRAELEAAIAAMPRRAVTSEPAQLLRGRIERMKATGEAA